MEKTKKRMNKKMMKDTKGGLSLIIVLTERAKRKEVQGSVVDITQKAN